MESDSRPAQTPPFTGVIMSPVRVYALVGLGLLVLYGIWMQLRMRDDPELVFLAAHEGAEWIVANDAISLATRPTGHNARGFRVRLSVTKSVGDAELEVRALRVLNVLIDGRVVLDTTSSPARWKSAYRIPLAPTLTPGDHELTILVRNETGPAALWARCPPLGIQTDSRWEASDDGKNWAAARLARARSEPVIAREFPAPDRAFGDRAAWLALLFAAVAFAGHRLADVAAARARWLTPARWRWVVLTGWAALVVHNLFILSLPTGFDVGGHLEYIRHIIENGRLPLATDGWQMFQSPLFYAVGAGFLRVLQRISDPDTSVLLLRLLPLACGLGQIELSYRALRRLWPERPDLQFIGTTFAALLPMNLYLSHYVGNEPLAGLLSAAGFVLALRWLKPLPGEDTRRTPWWLGLLLGLGLLTKVSAVLVVVPLLLAAGLAVAPATSVADRARHLIRSGAIVLGIAGAIAGWYYVRNLVHLGRPFVGGWDLQRGLPWWQDPGYRVAGDFLTFGASLARPVAASLVGFWDGLYATFWSDSLLSSATLASAAPPWNHGAMAAGVLLALAPSVAMVIGGGLALRAVWRESDAVALITLATVAVYGVALLHHALTLPYYCAIKAFYTIGAMPAYVLLFVTGVAWLTRSRVIRPITYGLLACWAVTVGFGFFAQR